MKESKDLNEVNFDKFMDCIVVDERKKRKINEYEETPQRKLARLHRELPQNRIRFGANSNG